MLLGETVEFRRSGQLLRGVVVYRAPDWRRVMTQWVVRQWCAAKQALHWRTQLDAVEYFRIPNQVTRIPAPCLVRVIAVRRDGAWVTWTAGPVWEPMMPAADQSAQDDGGQS